MNYVTRGLLAAVAALGVVAAINRFADPFGAFTGQMDDRPLDRPLFETNARLAKARIVSRFKPQAILLGSSRAEIGLSPSHPTWSFDRVYNLGLPMASIEELAAYFRHSIATGSLRQAVVGLDFFQFNPLLEPRADFSRCRLQEPGVAWSRIRAEFCDLPTLLLSRRALEGAIALRRAKGEPPVYLRDGSRGDTAKEKLLRRVGSQYEAFHETELEFFRQPELLRGYLDATAGFEEASARHFDDLLRVAHRHSIDLRIFISPTHVRQLEVIDELGLWDEFVRWKGYLMNANLRIARELQTRPFAIWDFADYNEFTTEPVPPPGDPDARMTWYWESGHYTRVLGSEVLEAVLTERPTALGRRLQPEEFPEWIRSIEARREVYRIANQDELVEMRDRLHRAASAGEPANTGEP